MRLKLKLTLLLMILLGATSGISAAETAEQLMNRVATAFKNASSLSATFSMSGPNGTVSGTFASSKSKFSLVTNGPSTWFNGTYMWTYNPRTGETTLVKPTASEVAESNPFSIISRMSDSFNANYAKSQPAGTNVLVLFPKKSGNNIKKVVLTLDAKRGIPKKMVITDASGTVTVNVSKFAANTKIAASAFEYPKAKYPKAKVVDLR